MNVQATSTAFRRWLVRGALVVWGVILVLVCATLLAGHFYTLPLPEITSSTLQAGIDRQPQPAASEGWFALHVLYARCSCSGRIVEHLLGSARPAGFHEKLLVVDPQPEWERRAREAGFDYETTTRARLVEEFAIEAAPLLVVSDASGTVRYAGGYSDRKQALAIRDREILESLRRAIQPKTIPLYGCAVSRGLQQAFDPLGLKYGAESGG